MGSGPSAVKEDGGFRIFKVNPGSPAFEAGLEVFFDFIVEMGGCKMDDDQRNFCQRIQEAENARTKLIVYNIRTHTSRDVYVMPRRWGGAGLLGAVVRYDSLGSVDNQGIRVLDVFPNSPAQLAGLIPFKDYLLGTTEVMFGDMDELVEIVNLCIGKSMQIYVYNSDAESIREVTITPNNTWGGDGSIGADIRSGLLHRIPAPRQPFSSVQVQPSAYMLQPALYPDPVPAQDSSQAPVPAGAEQSAPPMPTALPEVVPEMTPLAVPAPAPEPSVLPLAPAPAAPGVAALGVPAPPAMAAADAAEAEAASSHPGAPGRPATGGPGGLPVGTAAGTAIGPAFTALAATIPEGPSASGMLSAAEPGLPEHLGGAPEVAHGTSMAAEPPKMPPPTWSMDGLESTQSSAVSVAAPLTDSRPPDAPMKPSAAPDLPPHSGAVHAYSQGRAPPGVALAGLPPAPGIIYEAEVPVL